jgi:Fe-S oxidoreductase
LTFARSGGLDLAIEQCNGQGQCRKDTGVMCPSYQATRDEMHSTRGRANLLRAMIRRPWTADHGPSSTVHSLSSYDKDKVEATAQALDLCLACKGCKSECPSGVDMAKLKFAFQEQYYKTHRRHLRDYVFGYFHLAAGLAASIAPITNAMMGFSPIQKLFARVLGITDQRPIPKFTNRRSRFQRDVHGHKKVIFLSDAFARYIEPETEQAALAILSSCGYNVHVLPIIGAGASLYSKGFIAAARHHAEKVLDALKKTDPTGTVSLVGIEPPEVYFLKNEYIDLLPERKSEIEQHLNHTWLLDEFLLRSAEFSDLRIVTLGQHKGSLNGSQTSAPSAARRVRFHPHCHQRAEGLSEDGYPTGTNATIDLLRSCGYEVELLDTGCCGMAGTFGYEAEHYDLSMKVGELKLFPLLRKLEEQAIGQDPNNHQSSITSQKSSIASSGAACRMQIRQGTGMEAVHPIVLVADWISGAAATAGPTKYL